MAAHSTLVLRDIHQPPAPPWWPPAPGWWLVAAVVAAILITWAALRLRERRRRAARAAVFDAEVAAAATHAAEVAAMSGLLRRAARQRDAAADRLQGEAWLAWLDGDDAGRPFTAGVGRLLLDGGFRPEVEPEQVAALRPVARARFVQLLESGRTPGGRASHAGGNDGREPAARGFSARGSGEDESGAAKHHDASRARGATGRKDRR